ncbi:uncharacterized protein BCR38DRAFT_481435 [Pseudomassariella vexata]|uniref:C2H2-type domain-containing protein n=1 Tax=Pseudomassariella vexata TaxID=1141098 RepID=A0A1Y2EFD6_9PEZI|nr:uncharacterized protein BCR38DRAFT_481435 [Pseudomassariella vexata]ORY70298.1 hypothetical protein BCR38DRAFT_481435 [Pseudomassariella vexata]
MPAEASTEDSAAASRKAETKPVIDDGSGHLNKELMWVCDLPKQDSSGKCAGRPIANTKRDINNHKCKFHRDSEYIALQTPFGNITLYCCERDCNAAFKKPHDIVHHYRNHHDDVNTSQEEVLTAYNIKTAKQKRAEAEGKAAGKIYNTSSGPSVVFLGAGLLDFLLRVIYCALLGPPSPTEEVSMTSHNYHQIISILLLECKARMKCTRYISGLAMLFASLRVLVLDRP